jgi:type IV pilus assembly protein PilY1
MRRLITGWDCALCLLLLAPPLAADDIDIYRPPARALSSNCPGLTASLVAAAIPLGNAGRNRAVQDVFFNLFQPGAGVSWRGNIKKLQWLAPAGAATGADGLATAGIIAQAPLTDPPVAAISPVDGQILPDALTFWTDPTGADVLAFNPDLGEVPGRDGRSVTRGGAGQQVPGFLSGSPGADNGESGARQLFTLAAEGATELLPLNATAASLALLGPALDPANSMSGEQQLAVLRWLRGLDSFDADSDGDYLETRPWLLADAPHSRPLAVSYGARTGTGYSADNPDIRLFFGGNDGFFHMLRNTYADTGARQSGRETWAFIPPSLLRLQAELAVEAPLAAGRHRYGLDGEPVAYILDRDRNGVIDAARGDRVWVYIGQRRGGSSLFAFDMSDPDQPRYKWRIGRDTPGFEQLALTFSTPRIAQLDLGEAAPTPALIFAGGYHGGWSGEARAGKDAGDDADTRGNAIYVVRADTGALVWKAVGPGEAPVPRAGDDLLFVPELMDSIPSPLTVIDADRNGVEDRAYVGDSGGKVWRLDLDEHGQLELAPGAAASGRWRLRLLASLGGSGAADRRFFHAPDVVQSRDAMGDYDGVVIVSGNRAAPTETRVRDFAYLLKDRGTAGAAALDDAPPVATITEAQLADVGDSCRAEETSGCATGELSAGWKLALQGRGEKGLSTPLVSNGSIVFTSYVPAVSADQACPLPLGRSRTYKLALRDGAPRMVPAGNLQPQQAPVPYRELGPGLRGDVVPLQDGLLLPVNGGADDQLLTVPGRTRWRAYWRQEGVDEP